ncbi:hypothetical protein [Chondromyces crocatus]|uniref:hypothetical protein n=1 Tax=Chondromyces crocatus TaxID=52 RepID=UPI0012E328AD|nr:hypothetical protein [Chondromyces crocatus]
MSNLEEEEDIESGEEGPPEVLEGAVQIALLSRSEWPRPIAVSREQRKPFGVESDVTFGPGGLLYGVLKDRRKPHVAAWSRGGDFQTAEDTPLPGGRTVYLAARDDGGAALIGLDFDSLWEVTFAERTARRLLKHEESLSDIAYGAEGRLLMLLGSRLESYRRIGLRAVLDRQWELEGYGMTTLHQGRLVAVKCVEGDRDGITLYGFDGATLRRLARVRANAGVLFGSDERVFFEHNGAEAELYELTGTGALLDALEGRPTSFAEIPVTVRFDPSDVQGAESEAKGLSDEAPLEDLVAEDEEDDEQEGGAPKKPQDFVLEPAPGRIGVRFVGAKSPVRRSREEAIPKEVRALFGARSNVSKAGEGDLYFGWKKDKRSAFRFAIARDGAVTETELKSSAPSTLITLVAGEPTALVATDDDSKLWKVALDTGKASLVWDFSRERDEKEIYVLQGLAHGRVLVGTASETWIFSLAGPQPTVEVRGQLDTREADPFCGGRVVVLQARNGRPLRLWGIFPAGIKTLAGLRVRPASVHTSEGKLYVSAEAELGWFEILNVEDAWTAAERDVEGTRYPHVDLVRAVAPEEDEVGDEDDEDDDDESEDAEEKDEDSESYDGGDDEDDDENDDDDDDDDDD